MDSDEVRLVQSEARLKVDRLLVIKTGKAIEYLPLTHVQRRRQTLRFCPSGIYVCHRPLPATMSIGTLPAGLENAAPGATAVASDAGVAAEPVTARIGFSMAKQPLNLPCTQIDRSEVAPPGHRSVCLMHTPALMGA